MIYSAAMQNPIGTVLVIGILAIVCLVLGFVVWRQSLEIAGLHHAVIVSKHQFVRLLKCYEKLEKEHRQIKESNSAKTRVDPDDRCRNPTEVIRR